QKIEGLETKKPEAFFKKLEKDKDTRIDQLIKDLQTLNKTNIGGEFLDKKDAELILSRHKDTIVQNIKIKVKKIYGEDRIVQTELAKRKGKEQLISKTEKDLLSISKGTLSQAERQIINDHAERSWRWLMKLPFPKKKMKLPLYAGAHHETLNGEGYPNKLKANQLPIQSRIIAIADIFEALTANDRPYKPPMKLSKALEIMGYMVKDNHLDAEIAKIFLLSGLYQKYAKKSLKKNQIDSIDVSSWLEKFYPKDFKPNLPEQNI
ncbi:hypothetical protein KKA14_07335, partial [bacterium]|nr:hypothetical protein [bacterium]